MFVATLIAAGRLTSEMVREAIDHMAAADLSPDAPVWLDEGDAVDIRFQGSLAEARSSLSAFAPAGMDVVVQPEADRAKKMIIADMDSTMITVECIDELADYAGLKPQIAAITEKAMRGELDFRDALAERVGLLAGMSETTLAECRKERVSLTPGARVLVQTMKAHGAHAVLISGGFMPFAGPVGAEIGFDQVVANELEIRDGHLTGHVVPPIIDSAAKLAKLESESAALSLSLAETLAVGDGANDIPMLAAAGLGIGYHPHPAAAKAADAAIAHHDLTALLWAQGYSRQQWAHA